MKSKRFTDTCEHYKHKVPRISAMTAALRILPVSTAILLMTFFLTCEAQQHQYFLERPQNMSVREGQVALLRCKVGHQQGKSQWTKDGLALGFERIIPGYPRYTVVGDSNSGENNLRIENATLEDDAEYQCQVGPRGNQKPIRADARLTVLIPPTSVEIQDHAAGSRVEIRENEEYALQCVVRNAKPAADIVWYKRNVELKTVNREDSIVDAEREKRFDTKSKITIRAQADDNDADYSCEARHPALTVPKRTTVSFSVLYPPGAPEIVGYREEERVLMGQEVTLSCVSRGGNPLPRLVWYKNDAEVDFSYNSAERESRNTYIFVADASDNNAKFRCEASNAVSPVPQRAEITLTVHFPPTSVTVKSRPEKLRPGQVTTLSCESSSSYPAAKLSWWRNGAMIPALSNSTSVGQFGGTVSRSSLQLEVVPELDGAVYTCMATNGVRDLVVQDSVTLEVLYKPQFVQGPEYKVNVEEGKPAVVNMTVRSNPSNVTYMWSKGSKTIGSGWDSSTADRISASGPLLSLSLVRREDSGEYKCQAANSEGTNFATVQLNVLYGTSIVRIRSQVMVSEGGDAFLECQATGNPLTRQTVKWRRRGFDMDARTEQSLDVGVAYLTVKEVTRHDIGAFECVADNGIAEEVVEKTWLLVKYKPVMDMSAQYQKAAGDIDQVAKLVCRATGAPNITFNWTRQGVALSSSAKHQVQTDQVGLITWQSTLHISTIESTDYGLYECIARNEMGLNKTDLLLSPISQPDTPTSLRVMNVSHDAVLLSWIPAFDGGMSQAFRIRYQQAGSESLKSIDVYPSEDMTFTVNGLSLGTEYLFSVAAFNNYGQSNYTSDKVTAKTSSEAPPPSAQKPRDLEVKPGEMPKMLIIIITMVGTALLVLNVALIACFVRRRHRKRLSKATSSEGGSSKSATIEMYAPSSYNETVNGETLSSISEKSESYSHNGSHSDYVHDDASKPAVSTYLIDQSDSQPPYGSYRVNTTHGQGTLTRQPKTVNFDMGDDNYIDTLRRNAFSQAGEPVYGKTRGQGPIAANPDSYYTTSTLGDQSRYVAFPPAPPSFTNGPLRYNALSEVAGPSSLAPGSATSPYTPMGSLNIPAGRQPSSLPMNLPLPLPLSMQAHGHYPHYPEGPASLEANQYSGTSKAAVRSLETEGHLV